MSAAVELFIIGITTSFSLCLAFCSPVILPYITATRRGWREGIKAISIFLFTRLLVYVFLGLLAGLFGGLLTEWFHQFRYLVFFAGGLFISLLGLLIVFSKGPGHHHCLPGRGGQVYQALRRQVVDNSVKGPMLLGLAVGILPCLPLLGVLAYISLLATNLWQGAFYGFAFGMGKSISPLIPLGILASVLPERLIKNHRIYSIFSRFCGVILFLLGLNLVISRL